jgi:hypothetical protein
MYNNSNSELTGVFDNILSTINKGVSVVEKNFQTGMEIYSKYQQMQMVKKERERMQRQAEEVARMRQAQINRQRDMLRIKQQRASLPLMQRLGIGGSMMPIMLGVGGLGLVAFFVLKPKRR